MSKCAGLAVSSGTSVVNKERVQLRVWGGKCLQVLNPQEVIGAGMELSPMVRTPAWHT